MRERDYVVFLRKRIDSEHDPDLARALVRGLTPQGLPSGQADMFARDLWGWSCSPSLAPDLMLGDEYDQAVAVYEFKSNTAVTNWPMRQCLRQAKPWPGERARHIRDAWLSDTDPSLDAAHRDVDCISKDEGCERWRHVKPKDHDLHFPVVPQGDVYASTGDYVPNGLCVPNVADLTFIFAAPHEAAVEDFFNSLVSADLWHVVRLRDALHYWRSQTRIPGMIDVVTTTEEFLQVQLWA